MTPSIAFASSGRPSCPRKIDLDGTCVRNAGVCRWVDQLLQVASKQAAAVQSPNGTVTDGHLLAPSPSGIHPRLVCFRTHNT